MANNVVYTIRIKNQNNDEYTPYNIGAKDENIEVNTGNDNNFLIQKESEIPLSTVLPLKLNQETINSETDIESFNEIIEQGIYSIEKDLSNGPITNSSNSNLIVLKVGSIIHQIFFKLNDVYSRSCKDGTTWDPISNWNKNIGTNFKGTDGSEVGIRGLVPAPTTEHTSNHFLKSNGEWTSLDNVFARLGESETFTGTPIFNAGFKSQGNTPSIFNNIVSITANNPANGKALTVSNGISAGGLSATGNISAAGEGSFNSIKINDTKASINNNGKLVINNTENIKIAYKSDGTISTVTGGAVEIKGGMLIEQSIYSKEKVYNAVWNDLADSIIVNKEAEIEAGYCYCLKNNKYIKSSKYLDNGIIGIHSDTYGFKMGDKIGEKQLDCAVAGFVLAYVDKDYLPGTALTCTKDGRLTKMKLKDKQRFPEKIIATYWKDEPNEEWGSDSRKVKVNGRKWVKIK